MPANIAPIFPITPVSSPANFVNADSTAAKTIYTPTLANGAKVEGIVVTNTDTSAYTMQLFLHKGGNNYLLGTATIPASAGNTGSSQPVNLLAAIAAASGGPNTFPVDANGNFILYLDSGSALWAGMVGAVASGKTVGVSVFAGEY